MRLRNAVLVCAALVLGSAATTIIVLTHDIWKAWLPDGQASPSEVNPGAQADAAEDHLDISPQAWESMGLRVERLRATSYWRTIQLPGQVVELPGHSDRIVTAPAAGVVQRIFHGPWDTVWPGEKVFTLALLSESIQHSQAALSKAKRELQTVQKQKELLNASARTGSVPAGKLLDLELQEGRLESAVDAYTFELKARGLSDDQIRQAAAGKFAAMIDIFAPPTVEEDEPAKGTSHPHTNLFEVQELKVGLGQQVQAGQVLGTLTHHHNLSIEGHAYRSEIALLEKVATVGTLVEVEWLEGLPGRKQAGRKLSVKTKRGGDGVERMAQGSRPPTLKLPVRTLGNVVEENSQVVAFYLPLANQLEREYERDGRRYRIWRYRPGERVRVHVPVEEFTGVFVLQREAVVREGVEHYVFRQNGDVFERKAVTVLFEDHHSFVLARDGSVTESDHIAVNNAASLNRALKTSEAQGEAHGHHHHHH